MQASFTAQGAGRVNGLLVKESGVLLSRPVVASSSGLDLLLVTLRIG